MILLKVPRIDESDNVVRASTRLQKKRMGPSLVQTVKPTRTRSAAVSNLVRCGAVKSGREMSIFFPKGRCVLLLSPACMGGVLCAGVEVGEAHFFRRGGMVGVTRRDDESPNTLAN